MTNLDQVFCKMSMSIWIRGMTVFLAIIFTFFGPQNWPFFGGIVTLPDLRFHFASFEVLLRNEPIQSRERIMVSNKNVLVAFQLKEDEAENDEYKCEALLVVILHKDITLPDMRFSLNRTSDLAKRKIGEKQWAVLC